MPKIKNALLRYRIIDKCIRDKYNPFPTKEMLRSTCEEALYGSTHGEHISDSTIEKDLFAMRMEHDAPIQYSKKERGYFYDNPDFTMDEIPLNEDDTEAIRFAATILSQFKGVEVFRQFEFAQEEGTFFLKADRKQLAEVFKPYVGGGMRAYLDFKHKHQDKIAYDAGLTLEPMEMAERMLALENLILSNPDLVMRDELVSQLTLEFPWFLAGLENTPAFDHMTQLMYDEHKEAIQHFIKKSSSGLKDLAQKFYDDIESNSWKIPHSGAWQYFQENMPENLISDAVSR